MRMSWPGHAARPTCLLLGGHTRARHARALQHSADAYPCARRSSHLPCTGQPGGCQAGLALVAPPCMAQGATGRRRHAAPPSTGAAALPGGQCWTVPRAGASSVAAQPRAAAPEPRTATLLVHVGCLSGDWMCRCTVYHMYPCDANQASLGPAAGFPVTSHNTSAARREPPSDGPA